MVTSIGMTVEELEESLADIITTSFEVKKVKGKIVIYTNLTENEYGDLVDLDESDDDADDSEDSDDDDVGFFEDSDDSVAEEDE
jgi:hypothetical protein